MIIAWMPFLPKALELAAQLAPRPQERVYGLAQPRLLGPLSLQLLRNNLKLVHLGLQGGYLLEVALLLAGPRVQALAVRAHRSPHRRKLAAGALQRVVKLRVPLRLQLAQPPAGGGVLLLVVRQLVHFGLDLRELLPRLVRVIPLGQPRLHGRQQRLRARQLVLVLVERHQDLSVAGLVLLIPGQRL
jgi:hypothetical protein